MNREHASFLTAFLIAALACAAALGQDEVEVKVSGRVSLREGKELVLEDAYEIVVGKKRYPLVLRGAAVRQPVVDIVASYDHERWSRAKWTITGTLDDRGAIVASSVKLYLDGTDVTAKHQPGKEPLLFQSLDPKSNGGIVYDKDLIVTSKLRKADDDLEIDYKGRSFKLVFAEDPENVKDAIALETSLKTKVGQSVTLLGYFAMLPGDQAVFCVRTKQPKN